MKVFFNRCEIFKKIIIMKKKIQSFWSSKDKTAVLPLPHVVVLQFRLFFSFSWI